MAGPRPTLILFVKEPRLGSVKKRLARDVGADAAFRFYRENLRRLFRSLGRDPRWNVAVAATPDRAASRPSIFHRLGLAKGTPVVPQGRGDLGVRMAHALAAVPARLKVLIGGDVPGIEPLHIARAFHALADADAVFAPARDGGFWLIGIKTSRMPPDLFHKARWSGPHALADCLGNLDKRRKAVLTDMLEDVDDGAALKRWREKSRNRRPRTGRPVNPSRAS